MLSSQAAKMMKPTPSKNLLLFADSDRLGLFVLIAVCLHGLVIFGVKLSQTELERSSPHTIDITLVPRKNFASVDKPDFLAQLEQAGGGVKKNKKQLNPKPASPIFLTQASIERPLEHTYSHRDDGLTPSKHIISSDHAKTVTNSSQDTSQHDRVHRQSLANTNTAAKIAKLTARIEQRMTAQANRPKRRYLSAATGEARDARYLEHWRKRIERIGNLHYPDAAKRSRLYGEVRLLVAINRDGSLQDVQIRQSSGHRILDDAAINIVKLAAPYEPLPFAMQVDTDILEIIRTWQFTRADTITTLH